METIVEAAQEYARKGWLVFPLHTVDADGRCTCGAAACADAGKHPRTQRGLREASRDPAQIEAWFGRAAPPANVAIVTGAASGLTVLDIDIGPGKFGAESWAEATRDHGEPETLVARTGSGGMHFLFAYNSALKTASNVLGKGVDCRNDGGYIVAAPSRHRSGGQYEWVNWGQPLAVLPAHLSRRKETRGRPRKDNVYRAKHTIEQVVSMLEFVPADDRDLWRSVGVILGREFDRADAAWAAYRAWADKYAGNRGRNHDQIMHEAFYDISQLNSDNPLSLGTIVKLAVDNGWAPTKGEVPIDHFLFYGPGNNYIYRPTSSSWIAAAVDAAVSPVNEQGKIMRASEWLQLNRLCTSMTCDPSLEDDYVRGLDSRNGEVAEVPGAALYNSYRRPTIELGDARLAQPFLQHVRRVFPRSGDADQFLSYMAHRVQLPAEKPRFALLIAGGQGVGKDTAVEMCCPAIGPWNVANIEPAAFDSAFNEFAAATLVRISEAANLHEMSKWAFNERTKVLIAGAPDICQINPKYGQKYSIRMFCGVIITTNHLAGGIYIPEDDRRYDVIEAATMQELGLSDEAARRTYFEELWGWFYAGGDRHIAALLTEWDLSRFSAANGQRKTSAHSAVVAAGMSGDQWLEAIIDELGWPRGLRNDVLIEKAVERGERINDVNRKLRNALGRLGYCAFQNKETKSGAWRIGGKLVSVYVNSEAGPDFSPVDELNVEIF